MSSAIPLDDPRLLPRMTQADLDRIAAAAPPELIVAPIWVCGSREPKTLGDGSVKSSKRPICTANGRSAASDNPKTWGPFDGAATRTLMPTTGYGIALVGVNLRGGPWVGLDLDHVIDIITGELLPAARALINTLPSTYTEVSPSGAGLRLFFRGQLPPEFKGSVVDGAFGVGTQLECYDGTRGARYLSVTGCMFEGRGTMVDASHDDLLPIVELQQRTSAAKKKTKNAASEARHQTDDHDRNLARASYVLDRVLPDPDAFAYDDWLRLVAACCSLGEPGRQVVESWCRRGPKYNPHTDATQRQAAGFDGSITVATLFAEADRVHPDWRADYAAQAADASGSFVRGGTSATDFASATPEPTTGRPRVEIDAAPFHTLLSGALYRLSQRPDVAVREGVLVQVLPPSVPGGPPSVRLAGRGLVRDWLSQDAHWCEADARNPDAEKHPPAAVVEALVERRIGWAGLRVLDPRHFEVVGIGSLSLVPEPRDYLLRYATRNGAPVAPGDVGDGFGPMGVASFLVSEGGIGKTTLLMMLAVAIVTGKPWLGFEVDRAHIGQKVMLVLAEEDIAEVRRRLFNIAEHYGLTKAERIAVDQRIIVAPLKGRRCPLFDVDAAGEAVGSTGMDALIELLHSSAEPWALVVLDPLARLFPGAESDNRLATAAVQFTEALTEVPGSPMVMLAHHSSKNARTRGDVDARGVTGLTDAARWALSLKASGADVEFLQSKSNYSAPMTKPLILRRERGGLLRLATKDEIDADRSDQQDARQAAVERDAKKVLLALQAARLRGEKPKSKKVLARLARLSDAAAGLAVDYLLSNGEFVRRRETGIGVWFDIGDPDDHDDPGDSDDDQNAGENADTEPTDHEDAAAADPVRAFSPHTPRNAGTRVPRAEAQERAPGSEVLQNAPERRNAAASEDDGQPEQPKGKRRKKTRVSVEPERVQPGDDDFGHGRKEARP